MKKLLALLAFTSLFFAGCSSSDDDSDSSHSETAILPTKFVQTYSENGPVYGSTFEYEGNKLKKIVDLEAEDEYSLFFYTGDLITKVEEYKKNSLKTITTYTYNFNQQLERIESIDVVTNKLDKLTTYILNADSTVQVKTIQYWSNGSEYVTEEVFTLLNGEVVKSINKDREEEYIYDLNKNSEIKNILGVDKIYLFDGEFGAKFPCIEHKTIDNGDIYGRRLNYTYNAEGYPIFAEGEDYYNERIDEKFTYTIEYNK